MHSEVMRETQVHSASLSKAIMGLGRQRLQGGNVSGMRTGALQASGRHLGLIPAALGVPTLPVLLGPPSFRALTGLLSLLRTWSLPFRKSLASPSFDVIGFFFRQVNQIQKTVIEPLKK